MSNVALPLHLERVSVRYGQGAREVWAVRGVTLEVHENEFVAITGPSGSGKTSLLNVAAGLLPPIEGEVLVRGRNLYGLGDRERSRIRRREVAYIFQFFNLLPTLTARENVAVPLRADGLDRKEIAERTSWGLEVVAMEHHGDRYPEELSGGELQRVAIARALATRAPVLLADEPTGNLDSTRGAEVLEILRNVTGQGGRSVVLVTHEHRAAGYGDRVLVMQDGGLVDGGLS